MCLIMFYVIFFGRHPTPFLSGLGIYGLAWTVLLPVYLVAQMKLNYKTTEIDVDAQTITFNMFLLPISKSYSFSDFDGYVSTEIKDKYSTYPCYYLAKDGRLMYKMSGRYYENIDEIKEGLAGLKDLGVIPYTFSLSIKIARHQQVL